MNRHKETCFDTHSPAVFMTFVMKGKYILKTTQSTAGLANSWRLGPHSAPSALPCVVRAGGQGRLSVATPPRSPRPPKSRPLIKEVTGPRRVSVTACAPFNPFHSLTPLTDTKQRTQQTRVLTSSDLYSNGGGGH